MSPSTSPTPDPKIIQWILDTRPLWPIPQMEKSRDQVQELPNVASRAFSLITEEQKTSVLKYYHRRDAKMALASILLKNLVVAKFSGIPWKSIKLQKSELGKPIYVPDKSKSPAPASIEFNVSHQAGIVSLIAAIGYEEKVEVGTDVVCVSERGTRDGEMVDQDGFFAWVDMHAEVFAASEVRFMQRGPIPLNEFGIPGTIVAGGDKIEQCEKRTGSVKVKIRDGDREKEEALECKRVIEVKFRRFYAMWCLRETYVKMTGEALLAPWLKELEISKVKAPAALPGQLNEESLKPGEIGKDFHIRFKGKEVTDVKMELSALGRGYMVGGAVRGRVGLEMGSWVELNLEKDIFEVAEGNP
ncbi:hypothetical protein HYALB_00009227 [Hymenoscyphus albidus]|uniref:holo-[acyl-carrier-protein] synthase n=1 Tax=Hymenoscyphus albidus TaxID=595503 RepID=A0A9N9PQQ5_9HELO|nr:hypothetical protein HYALB_00009227 [Hymenoscyphus albidus]